METPQAPFRATLGRSIRLLGAFRKEQSDPDFFYGMLARDTVAQLASYTELDGALVADVGGGPGYFTDVLRVVGARPVCVDCDAGEMMARQGAAPEGAVLGSALDLPLATGSVDVCFSSNVLEHVPDPWRMADEMVRVTRPGGVVYLSFTNWLSPWGGHETSPGTTSAATAPPPATPGCTAGPRRTSTAAASTRSRSARHCAGPGGSRTPRSWTPCPATTRAGRPR